MASAYILLAELQRLAPSDAIDIRELLGKTLTLAHRLHDGRMADWIQRQLLDAQTDSAGARGLISRWLRAVEEAGVQNLTDEESATGYDVAQVCLNGHVANPVSKADPSENRAYCPKCGAATISYCPRCEKPIRGAFVAPDVIADPDFALPAFCENCGVAFPWTAEKLAAAKEFTEGLEQLTPEERSDLKATLDDLVRETPRTAVAESKFKRLVKKAGKEAADGMRALTVDIVSEAVKKSIWP